MEEKYYEFGIRVDYDNNCKIHEESYFFKHTSEGEKSGKLELIAKEDNLFPGLCIDYEFLKEKNSQYKFKLKIKGDESLFLFKIDENGNLVFKEKSPKEYLHHNFKIINEQAYRNIEYDLDKDIKEHIIENNTDKTF